MMMTTTILRLRRAAPQTGIRTLLTLSQVKGPTVPPLLAKTLPEFFRDDILARHADQPALISTHERADVHSTPWRQQSHSETLHWNFAEFDNHIEALAKGLSHMGIQKGDRVGVVLGNSSPYAVLQWACARIGAIIVTINPAYKMHELVSMLNLVTVKALFIVPQLRGSHYTAALLDSLPSLSSSRPNEINDTALPSLRSLVLIDNTGGSPNYAAEKYGGGLWTEGLDRWFLSPACRSPHSNS